MIGRLFNLILPLLFACIAISMHFNWGNFYENSVDPEYTILYNGIVVSTGSFAINFIDHPATPLIFISGFSSLWVNLFTAENSLVEDFVQEPEKYLHAANLLLIVLISLSIYYAFKQIRKHSTSEIIPLIIGFGLLANWRLFEISSRLIPEACMLIPLLMLISLSIQYLNAEPPLNQSRKLAFWVAFGIACKLHFAPLLLWPLFMIQGQWREILKYFGWLTVFTSLLAYPLLTNLEKSSQWFTKLFTHSGKHGQGSSDFIDLNTLPENATSLFKEEPLYFSLLLIVFGLSTFILLKNNKPKASHKLIRLSIGLSLSLLLLSFFVSKHYALHYFMPFFVLKGFLVYLLIRQLYLLLPQPNLQLNSLRLGLLLMLVAIGENTIKARNYYQNQSVIVEKRSLNSSLIKEAMQNEPSALIIDAPYWGTPFPAYAHAYGFMNSFKRKTYFKSELRKQFPNTYIYVGWMEELNHWDKFVSYEELLKMHDSVYLYSSSEKENVQTIVNRMMSIAKQDYIIAMDTVVYQAKKDVLLLQFKRVNQD